MNEEDLRERIGERLKKLRKGRGLTQKELVKLVGEKTGRIVDYTYLGRIERGVQYPSLKILGRIAKSFSVPIEYFFVDKKKAKEIERTVEEVGILKKLKKLTAEEKQVVNGLIKRLAMKK